MSEVVSQFFGELKQGFCDEEDFEWRGSTQTEDGILWVWLEAQAPELGAEPSAYQLKLLDLVMNNMPALKQHAVEDVRRRLLADPESYGLSDETEDFRADFEYWTTLPLTGYLSAFQLRQLGIPVQEINDEVVCLGFETKLDFEHGVVVEMQHGNPIREGMWADFGSMLILEP